MQRCPCSVRPMQNACKHSTDLYMWDNVLPLAELRTAFDTIVDLTELFRETGEDLIKISGKRSQKFKEEYKQRFPVIKPITKGVEFAFCMYGSVIVAASGLTGRLWTGSLWYFEEPSSAPDVNRCSAWVRTEAGITDVEWIDENRLAIGSDTGAIEIWQLESSSFRNLFYLYEHDSAVNSVSVNSNKTRVISGSSDRLIKVWDLATQRSIGTLNAHTAKVEQVACSPNELEVFMSCSQDGSILLWDMRKEKPAQRLSCQAGLPTSVVWKPGESYVIAVGEVSGSITVQDARSHQNAAIVTAAHTRAVHRLAFSTKSPLLLASVSDDCTAAVTELQPEVKQIYRSYAHNDFVHGLSWDTQSNKLLTCGWDRQVISHDINIATSMAL